MQIRGMQASSDKTATKSNRRLITDLNEVHTDKKRNWARGWKQQVEHKRSDKE